MPVYFNKDFTITNGTGSVTVPRGTLFGQLTLAGHGMSYSESEIPSFETEMETEMQTPMPLNPNPFPSVAIEDFASNYSAIPLAQLSGSYVSNGAFFFTVSNVTPGSTNYVQASTDLSLNNWLTLSTNLPATNSFTVTDPAVGTYGQRFYRVLQIP